MIYLNANRIFSVERATDPAVSLDLLGDLLPDLSNTKIIYAIGDGAEACSSYISEALLRSGFSVFRCRANSTAEAKQKFLINGSPLSVNEACERIEDLSSRLISIRKVANPASNRIFDTLPLSAEEFSFLLSAELVKDISCDIAIFELSDQLFENVISKLPLSPACAILTSFCEETVSEQIETMPSLTANIVRYSHADCFDFISNTFSSRGARISTVSDNKITYGSTSLYGCELFYNSDQFNIRSVEKKSVIYAALAIEALMCSGLCVSRAAIHQGLANAMPLCDARLISLSPVVYTKITDSSDELSGDLFCFEEKALRFIREGDDIRSIIARRDFDIAIIIGKYDLISKMNN